jgi:hypothetical protein
VTLKQTLNLNVSLNLDDNDDDNDDDDDDDDHHQALDDNQDLDDEADDEADDCNANMAYIAFSLSSLPYDGFDQHFVFVFQSSDLHLISKHLIS